MKGGIIWCNDSVEFSGLEQEVANYRERVLGNVD